MSVDPLCLPARGATALASPVALPDATSIHVLDAAAAGITSRRHVRVEREIMLITYVPPRNASWFVLKDHRLWYRST